MVINRKHTELQGLFFFSIITAYNVNVRHMLVKGAIGVFPEEEYAYWMVNKLSWVLPLTIVSGAVIDAFLVYIYMRFAHPWKDILFYKDKKPETEENEIVDQISTVTEEGEQKVAPETIPTSIDLEDDLLESTDL
jgi:hypothetical protein